MLLGSIPTGVRPYKTYMQGFYIDISIAYHNASPDTLDFKSGAHNFTQLFEIAHKLGLYVIFRPGPYVNAETTAGAFPSWVTTGEYGRLRDNDPRYTKAWKPFFEEISKIIAPYQVTKEGGNVLLYQLENEFGEQWSGDPVLKKPNYPAIEHMELLEKSARDSGIDIPLFHNNPNMWTRSWSKDFSNVGGELDVYGIDHYPECWSKFFKYPKKFVLNANGNLQRLQL